MVLIKVGDKLDGKTIKTIEKLERSNAIPPDAWPPPYGDVRGSDTEKLAEINLTEEAINSAAYYISCEGGDKVVLAELQDLVKWPQRRHLPQVASQPDYTQPPT